MIYFLLDIEYSRVKIGTTQRGARRPFGQLAANGGDVLLLGTVRGGAATESRLHSWFHAARVEGKREWFNLEVGASLLRSRQCRPQSLYAFLVRKGLLPVPGRFPSGSRAVPAEIRELKPEIQAIRDLRRELGTLRRRNAELERVVSAFAVEHRETA